MSPGAVSHIRARATSGRSVRPRTIICSTASRLCDSATANMTFCNDATSIVSSLHVRDTFVKQLVQILARGGGVRNTGETLVPPVQEDSSCGVESSSVYTGPGPFKTDFLLSIILPLQAAAAFDRLFQWPCDRFTAQTTLTLTS